MHDNDRKKLAGIKCKRQSMLYSGEKGLRLQKDWYPGLGKSKIGDKPVENLLITAYYCSSEIFTGLIGTCTTPHTKNHGGCQWSPKNTSTMLSRISNLYSIVCIVFTQILFSSASRVSCKTNNTAPTS
ncbi:uncharacterized protein EV154DRAFT_479115 [Mucor mucedo]|uniref:uncharacterized protein n=1 Tax=Mucor mucedo TaxID=29922 RepID=UPI002220B1F0|nr:uncharacterized protein EV154DRAFT_479115 [Mucor mucedo]KAI7893585.1 hypothetical protein EV154DRAFT_479115 [Mucor mucedo]